MLNSMTGYGEAEGKLDGVSYAIELKAVNNRYLKTIIKLPDNCTFLEDDVDKAPAAEPLAGHDQLRASVQEHLGQRPVRDRRVVHLRSIVAKLNDVSCFVGVKGQIDLAGLWPCRGSFGRCCPTKRPVPGSRSLSGI